MFATRVLSMPTHSLSVLRVIRSFLALAVALAVTGLPQVRSAEPIVLPAGVQEVTSVEGITEYKLANGLTVLLFPDLSKPTVTVNITYKVGSRHEAYGEKGMAHLLEHLLFKGTPRHPNIPQELTERGTRPNGTTWLDRTNYFETMAASDDNLRWALDLEADRMVNSYVRREDLEKEFTVVRNEFERGENSPGSVLYKRMLPALFQWHNYGHSTIGERSDIEGAPIERLQAFYRTYYQPDNAVLLVAGRFEVQKALNWVVEFFGKIPKPDRVLIPTYTSEPTQDGERDVTLRRTGDVQLSSVMYRSSPGSHPDHAAMSVLTTLLTDEPTGRLYKELVEKKKAARVGGGASGFAEAGYVNFVAEVRMEQSLPEARAAMLQVLEGLREAPPTAEEVERAKVRLIKNFELLLRNSERLGLTLSEFIGMGDWRLAYFHRDNLEKITLEDVRRVAGQYFKQANRVTGYFIPDAKPDRAEIPPIPDVAAVLKDYKGKPPISEGENFEGSPENIEKRTTRGVLPNGVKYALLPKETRGDAVNASLTFRFGTLETLRGKATTGAFTATLLSRGTEKKSRQQIKDALDKLKARLNVGGGPTQVGVFIEADRKNLADVIRLAAEILREPSFPVEELETFRQEYLSGIEQQKSDPSSLGSNLFARISRPPYAKDDPRYTMTFDEEMEAVKAVKLEDLKVFHRSFYGASDATAAFSGDFDPAEVTAVLQEAFGDWKSPGKYERIASPYEPVPVRSETINTPDKANATYIAGYGFAMRDDDPDYPALTMTGYMLGGGFLNSRLATRIRQKDGLSYSVRGGFGVSALDKDANFSASMIYNPQNLAKLEAAFRDELERAARDGFTSEELEAAKTGWLKSRKVSRSDDNDLASTLNWYLFLGRDFLWDAKRESAVEALKLEDVNAVAKKYLDASKAIVVKAGDFNKLESAKLDPPK
jgi:zinc protease